MAEAGLVATIIGIAGAGVKLSITLYTFAETVATASSEIKNVARDVSLTSSVLEQLGAHLEQDEDAKLYSGSAVETVKDVMTECEVVFQEIEGVLAKATDSVAKRWPRKGGKVALSAMDRLKWPFLQPKMALLRSNLERLKSTLMLVLNVLIYARDSRVEKESSPTGRGNDLYQRTLLENLFLANQQATRKYEALLSMIESQGENALAATGQSLYQDPGSEPELAPSVRHSLKHIQRALLQFERSAPMSYGSSRMGVQIELEKELSRSRDARAGSKPWVLVSIGRKEEVPPSYNESWIPSEGEMYGSIAAGALEGLTVADYDERSRSRSRSRSRVRFQGQYHDPYQPYQNSQPGPSRRTDALQADIDETMGLMHENTSRVSQRGERQDSLVGNADPLTSGAVQFRKGAARTKTWYESIFDSITSPNSAISSFQETVKNTGLFFGVEDNKENPDTVLEYRKDSRLASPPNSPGAKLGRSTTFDELLRSPSSEGQYTPPSTIVSKEEDANAVAATAAAEKPAEPDAGTHAPKVESAEGAAKIKNKIPFLVPAENEAGDISGRTTPDGTMNLDEKAPEAGEKPTQQTQIGAEEEKPTERVSRDHDPQKQEQEQEREKAEEGQPSEVPAVVSPSKGKDKGKGKATDMATDEQPDEIEQLLKEWTTVYE
ncbi:hypothetical protein G647_01283 [Cladophialophora carrionii CBS 160.54]|uniref:V-SNARE coiled-coil homology domain-containing protein n=1 Tax=Cladophialophora carrionii CBS 160.54 TaxID=1279043 RepID=V9DQA1_9EURO|nr:uncharacterized protein G647_01283 [Cladophialophora carrionii CBS 160.54]ETI28831.1 hypothetical protein G647_01283 [Cladophialophora carrionii CBS 160.54]